MIKSINENKKASEFKKISLSRHIEIPCTVEHNSNIRKTLETLMKNYAYYSIA
jgi:hypothetical protein